MLVSFQHNLFHQNQHSFVMHNHSLSHGYHIDRMNAMTPGNFDLKRLVENEPFSARCSFKHDESEEQAKPFIAECLPAGISLYGKAMLESPFELLGDLRSLTHELIFEMVRLRFFPHKPSRLSCLFACHDSDLASHMRCLAVNPSDYKQVNVAEVELPPSRYHVGDINWLEKISTVAGGIYNARHYWQGDDRIDAYFNKPIKEYLIPDSVKVLRVLSTEDKAELLGFKDK